MDHDTAGQEVEPITGPRLIALLRNGDGGDAIRGLVAASMSRYADHHFGLSEKGSAFRGKSIDFMQRQRMTPAFIVEHEGAWDWIMEDVNMWVEGLYGKRSD